MFLLTLIVVLRLTSVVMVPVVMIVVVLPLPLVVPPSGTLAGACPPTGAGISSALGVAAAVGPVVD